LTRRNCCAGPGSKVDAPEASSGPGWKVQEVSRVGAQGVTSKSKLLAREMPRVCSRGLQVDSGTAKYCSGRACEAARPPKGFRRSVGTWRPDVAGYLSPDRSPTPPAAAFAPGAPDLRTGGLQVDSGAAQLLKVASAGPKPERVVSGFRQATAAGESDAA